MPVSRSRSAAVLCLALCAGIRAAAQRPSGPDSAASAVAPSHESSARRDRYLRVDPRRPESAMGRLRDAILRELARIPRHGPGSPRLASVEWIDVPDDPGVKRFVCRPTAGSGPEVRAILLDDAGHCVRLDYRPTADARFVAFEVYLLTTQRPRALETAERYRIPRVIVEHPVLSSEELSVRVHAAIERALRRAGVRDHRYTSRDEGP